MLSPSVLPLFLFPRLLRYRLDDVDMTGVGDSKTGTFEEGSVANDASDRKGVVGGDKELESYE